MPIVLIIDDDSSNLEELRSMLQVPGHLVREAIDGVQALGVLTSQQIDSVLSDVHRPGIDVRGLCREICKNPSLKESPVLLYSSTRPSQEVRDANLSFGPNAYIERPVSAGKIHETLIDGIKEAGIVPETLSPECLGVLQQYSAMLIGKVKGQNIELIRRTAELQASEETLRQLTDHIREVFFTRELTTGRILYISRAFESIWGRSCEDLYRNPGLWTEAVHPEDRAEREAVYARFLKDPTSFDIEYRIQRPDGAVRWIRSQGFPVLSADGVVTRIVGIAEDITQRKKLEAQLFQAQKIEAVGQLAGGIAHDFNNLLTSILGYSNLILDRIEPNDPLREEITEIRKAGERAAALTRQLLALSRQQVLQPTRVDLNSTVHEMQGLLRKAVGENIELITNLKPDLGGVRVDPGQIEQVILNLAVNARDAMPNGGKLILETSETELDALYAKSHPGVIAGRYAMLCVSDTGSGMTDAVQSHVFEPFFTTKGAGIGTGLGLPTVEGIVRQSGGHVNFYSVAGRGTTFKIYLPLVDAPADPPLAPVSAPEPSRCTETILVVEDEEVVRSLVRAILKRQGYTVLEASNGNDALLTCGKHPGAIDLIITDIVMPLMSGPEFIKKLREVRGDIRALYTSGYSEILALQLGALEPMAPFMQKPYSVDLLARKVREILDAD